MYVGPEIIDKVRNAFDLKANSSLGANYKSIVTFSFFLTVPNYFEIFKNWYGLFDLIAKSKLKSPLFYTVRVFDFFSFTKILPKLI